MFNHEWRCIPMARLEVRLSTDCWAPRFEARPGYVGRVPIFHPDSLSSEVIRQYSPMARIPKTNISFRAQRRCPEKSHQPEWPNLGTFTSRSIRTLLFCVTDNGRQMRRPLCTLPLSISGEITPNIDIVYRECCQRPKDNSFDTKIPTNGILKNLPLHTPSDIWKVNWKNKY